MDWQIEASLEMTNRGMLRLGFHQLSCPDGKPKRKTNAFVG
jgi:hypothetical protein